MRDLYLACLHAEAPRGGEWEIDYDAQNLDPRYWDSTAAQEDDEEEVYDCPRHGVVTGPDCPRCA